jgi:hypothetical protein
MGGLLIRTRRTEGAGGIVEDRAAALGQGSLDLALLGTGAGGLEEGPGDVEQLAAVGKGGAGEEAIGFVWSTDERTRLQRSVNWPARTALNCSSENMGGRATRLAIEPHSGRMISRSTSITRIPGG